MFSDKSSHRGNTRILTEFVTIFLIFLIELAKVGVGPKFRVGVDDHGTKFKELEWLTVFPHPHRRIGKYGSGTIYDDGDGNSKAYRKKHKCQYSASEKINTSFEERMHTLQF